MATEREVSASIVVACVLIALLVVFGYGVSQAVVRRTAQETRPTTAQEPATTQEPATLGAGARLPVSWNVVEWLPSRGSDTASVLLIKAAAPDAALVCIQVGPSGAAFGTPKEQRGYLDCRPFGELRTWAQGRPVK
jgi:hypothetical protein